MKIPKYEWLTIPDAPNYEINGYFKIRNVKTGKRIKSKKRVSRPTVVATVFNGEKEIKRSVKTFYRQAVAALGDKFEWHLLPKPFDNYEINGFGEVRNASTKKELKLVIDHGGVYYHLQSNNKQVTINPDFLLAEIFGTPIRYKKNAVPVILKDGKGSWYFKSIATAAKFLAKKTFYSSETFCKIMSKRPSEIYGYRVTYLGKKYCSLKTK